MDRKRYAAKRLIGTDEDNAGIGEVSVQENFQRLSEELLRAHNASSIASQFTQLAKECQVAIHDIRVAEPFILQVIDGRKKGLAWIVDPLLPTTQVKKFSGTHQAGHNHGLLGYTIDAFAHYSLCVSEGTMVLTDIQGILAPKIIQGIEGAQDFVMFDLMSHTDDQASGLGDNGQGGIQQFIQQHVCNKICEQLLLDDLPTITDSEHVQAGPLDKSAESEGDSDSGAGHDSEREDLTR